MFCSAGGEVAGFFRIDRGAGPYLRHGGVLVSYVVRKVVAGRAEDLDCVFSHVWHTFHGAARNRVARQVEVVSAAAVVPVSPL